MLTTIFIDQLQIHAPIGWYEEERMNKVGLSVSVRLKLDSKSLSDELNQTIDYATITQWVLTIAERPVKLLETFAENILLHIESQISHGLVQIQISVMKAQIQARGVLAAAHGVEVEQNYPKRQDN